MLPTADLSPWQLGRIRWAAVPAAAPTFWPIAPADLEAAARILAGNEEPGLEQLYIEAATYRVQNDTGLALPKQDLQVQLEGFELGSGAIPLPWPPLLEITSIASVGEDGTETPIAPTRVDLVSRPARIWLPPGTSGQLTLLLTAGYADAAALPPPLKLAVQLLATHYLTTGRDPIVIGTIASEMPLGYWELIQPYRLEVLA